MAYKGGTAPKLSLPNIAIRLIWYVVILFASEKSSDEAKYSSVDLFFYRKIQESCSVDLFNSFICDVCLLKELHIGGLVISISKGSHNVAEK